MKPRNDLESQLSVTGQDSNMKIDLK